MDSVTTPQTKKMLEAQPHIDIRKVSVGTTIIIDASPHIYEFRVLNDLGMIEATSSDPKLRQPIVGIYVSGFYDHDDIVTFPWRIAATLKMKIRFLNGFYLSAPVLSARIIGKGYHYDVF
jgi:hypothetical protein